MNRHGVCILFALVVVAASPASAEPTYFDLSIRAELVEASGADSSSPDVRFNGYAWLDLANPLEVRGRLCIVGHADYDLSGVLLTDGRLDVAVGNQPDRMILRRGQEFFSPIPELGLSVTEWSLDEPVIFWNGGFGIDPIEFEMLEIPVGHILSYEPPEILPLATLDMQQAFEQGRLRNHTIVPGRALVVLESSARADWETSFAKNNAMIADPRGLDSSCAPPILIEEIMVAPMLEDWVAQRLTVSGAVIFGTTIEEEGGVTGQVIEINGGPAYDLWITENINVISARLQDALSRALEQFANLRRPGVSDRIDIIPLSYALFPLLFEFDIAGPALSVCDAGRWEMLRLQMLVAPRFTDNEQMGILIQFVHEPRFALDPGDRLPPQERFENHPLEWREQDDLLRYVRAFMEETNLGLSPVATPNVRSCN